MSDRNLATSPPEFVEDCISTLLGKRLSDYKLGLGSWEDNGHFQVAIVGPKPPYFDAICLAQWRKIGDDGWTQVMEAPVQYQWDSSLHGGSIVTIPGLGIALDLIADYPEPVRVDVPTPPKVRLSAPEEPPLKVNHQAPFQIAKQLILADWTWYDPEIGYLPTLHRIGGEFFQWDGSSYKAMSDAEMRSTLYERLNSAVRVEDGQPFNPDNTKISKIEDAVRAATYLDGDSGSAFWIDGEDGAGHLISVESGLLDPMRNILCPHTPLFFTRNTIPVWFQVEGRRVPVAWLEFLNSVWPDDPECHRLLQQWFGASVLGRNDYQKIFLLVGPPRSGKGTIVRILTALLGAANVAGPTLGDLASQFGLASLIGKKSAIIGDARFAGRPDQMAQVVSRLLSISGGDLLTVDRKHREPWIGRIRAQLMICSNELPRLSDVSGALASRCSVLQMQRSFLGVEDQGLADRLLAELPEILAWALEGLADLVETGGFIQPASCAATSEDLASIGSPISDFVAECCELAEGRSTPCVEVFEKWAEHCQSQGRERPGTLQMFARDLKAAFPTVSTVQVRSGEMRGKRAFVGICLREAKF